MERTIEVFRGLAVAVGIVTLVAAWATPPTASSATLTLQGGCPAALTANYADCRDLTNDEKNTLLGGFDYENYRWEDEDCLDLMEDFIGMLNSGRCEV